MEPDKGGLGAINLETYATSLRCSWYKRINRGLWSDIILDKVKKNGKSMLSKRGGHTPNAHCSPTNCQSLGNAPKCVCKTQGTSLRTKKQIKNKY